MAKSSYKRGFAWGTRTLLKKYRQNGDAMAKKKDSYEVGYARGRGLAARNLRAYKNDPGSDFGHDVTTKAYLTCSRYRDCGVGKKGKVLSRDQMKMYEGMADGLVGRKHDYSDRHRKMIKQDYPRDFYD